MDAALWNFKVQTAQDFLTAGNASVKIVDNETLKMG